MSAGRRVPRPDEIAPGRMEAFSDGVFAIVVTLLVLEIRVPHLSSPDSVEELARALVAMTPKFVSWAISFVTVCVIVLNHHRLFRMLQRTDSGLFWWNANLLLWTSFVAFPTALMGDYPRNALAASFYGTVMAGMALAFTLLRRHLGRHDELLHEHVDRAVFARGTRYAFVMGPLAYLLGSALAWVNVLIAFACYATIAVYFVFPHATRSTD